MDAVPKRWFRRSIGAILNGEPTDYWAQDAELKPIIYAYEKNREGKHTPTGIIIDCELAGPKSMEGRTVHVHIRHDEIEWLMKILRERAIERRSQPMSEAEKGNE